MTTKFSMTRDINGYNGFGLHFSDRKYNMLLLNGVEQTLTIPADNATYLMILTSEPGSIVWVADNATAVAPVGAIGAATSELNPIARYVNKDDVIHFITTDASIQVGVVLYAL